MIDIDSNAVFVFSNPKGHADYFTVFVLEFLS